MCFIPRPKYLAFAARVYKVTIIARGIWTYYSCKYDCGKQNGPVWGKWQEFALLLQVRHWNTCCNVESGGESSFLVQPVVNFLCSLTWCASPRFTSSAFPFKTYSLSAFSLGTPVCNPLVVTYQCFPDYTNNWGVRCCCNKTNNKPKKRKWKWAYIALFSFFSFGIWGVGLFPVKHRMCVLCRKLSKGSEYWRPVPHLWWNQ